MAVVNFNGFSVHSILVSDVDLFHGPVILLDICITILWIYVIFRTSVQYDTISDLIILVGHCDLYFMVQ